MASVVYSLKNGINRINNPTIGGVFAYGSYTSEGTFTLFTNYKYEDGTSFTAEPFDTSKALVWKNSSQYPHIGFENLSPNSSITPQPFPSFGIYLHPYFESGVRKDVGVRVTIPFGGTISILSTIQRGDTGCGDDIGYRIMKNGVAIKSRSFYNPSSTPTNVNTPPTIFAAGDIIDFIVDVGSQNNFYCDDTALEVSLVYEYTKIPTPIITTSPVICSTTTISGTTSFVSEGTTAELYIDSTLLASKSVTLDLVTYSGSFSFTGLDLTACKGKVLKIVLKKAGDIDSDFATTTIEDGGCVTGELEAPVVTEYFACKKKYIKVSKIFGYTEDFGDIAIYKYPYTEGDPIIASTHINMPGSIPGGGGEPYYYEVYSENFEPLQQYVAVIATGSISLSEPLCDGTFELFGIVRGYAKGITNGIINMYQESDETHSVANGIIREEKFEIKLSNISTTTSYVLITTKLN